MSNFGKRPITLSEWLIDAVDDEMIFSFYGVLSCATRRI